MKGWIEQYPKRYTELPTHGMRKQEHEKPILVHMSLLLSPAHKACCACFWVLFVTLIERLRSCQAVYSFPSRETVSLYMDGLDDGSRYHDLP